MLVTNVLAGFVALLGLAFVAMWLSPLEAQVLNVGHVIGLGRPEPRVSTLVAGIALWVLAALIGLAGRRWLKR